MKYRLLNSTKALVTLSAGAQVVCTYPGGAKAAQTALEAMGAVREGLAERLVNTLHDTANSADPTVEDSGTISAADVFETGWADGVGLLPDEVLDVTVVSKLREVARVVADYHPTN
jgi:hypothetical protein